MNREQIATFQFLARTKNEAAVEVLVAAIDGTDPAVREAALRTILQRPSSSGHVEVFRRLRGFDANCREILNERSDRLTSAAVQAVRTSDCEECRTACEAIVEYRLYDAMPGLLGILNGKDHSDLDRVAQTVLELADAFYGELSAPAGQPRRKDLGMLRERLNTSLEEGLRKYGQHGRKEVLEAFLLVTKPQNVAFRYLLQQPNDAAYAPVVEILSTSARGGVLRLLLGFLEDATMPQAIKKILMGRADVRFVENLVLSLGPKPSKAASEVLVQLNHFAWAAPHCGTLEQLSEPAQSCAVAVLAASGVKRTVVQNSLGHLLQAGRPAGRRAAVQALANFDGPEATAMVVRALNDDDPAVLAGALRQIRPRGVPGALSLLIRMADTPHEAVRQALRDAMPEFSLRHFLGNLDAISDELRPAVGHLVRKIDADAAAVLAEEMEGLSPVRRRKAVTAADAMGVAAELEEKIIRLLNDDDHMVRIAAARALEECGTQPTWEALRDALLDRSVVVQEVAERSLQRISRLLCEEEEGQQAEKVSL